jgi:hypothetical protein
MFDADETSFVSTLATLFTRCASSTLISPLISKLVSSSVSVAKLDNTELNEPSDYNVKGTESVVMEVLEHLLVNVCGKLDSKIVNDVQGTSHILGNDEEKTELSGTNIDFKESLTDGKIVSEVFSMPDQSDTEGINKINMENNPELTLEKESLTKNTEEEKFVQRNINAEENKDKMALFPYHLFLSC